MNTTQNKCFKAGTAGLLGWTNVGKSTLLNRITGLNLSITSFKPQTTRTEIAGIFQSDHCQVAFYDTPGIHHVNTRLSQRMVKKAWVVGESVDVLIWMVIATKSAHEQFQYFKKFLDRLTIPIIVVINKIDLIPKDQLLSQIDQYHKFLNPSSIIPISALKGWNVDRFIDCVCKAIPQGSPLYAPDDVTDKSTRFIISEKIRQTIIHKLKQELPHVVAIDIEKFKENKLKQIITISAIIYVEKNSQKAIVIGRNGMMLKSIGIDARTEIEKFLESKIHLQLWVKVLKNWRNDDRILDRFDQSN